MSNRNPIVEPCPGGHLVTSFDRGLREVTYVPSGAPFCVFQSDTGTVRLEVAELTPIVVASFSDSETAGMCADWLARELAGIPLGGDGGQS